MVPLAVVCVAFIEIRGYGISLDKLIDLHAQVAPLVDEISGILVRAARRMSPD
jgi:hypothetical protein